MKKIILLLVLLVSIFLTLGINVSAKTPLDRIDLYEITIDPNEDGTLNMHFNIKWTVLDSTSEGPLEWVKIGIPNKYVSNLRGESSCIKNIKYYSDSGSYIRLDLDRKYKAGESLEMKFSYTQSRMYFLKGEHCFYDYKPGWFDEIYVNHAVVKWNKTGVEYANQMSTSGNYYVWSAYLKPGETLSVDVKYAQSYFKTLDPEMQYTDDYMTTEDIVAIVLFVSIIVIMVTVLIISVVSQQDPYMRERGFVGRGYYYHRRRYYHRGYYSSGKRIEKPVVVNSGGFGSHGGSGGSCACACACACAGGGRAGCSMKDFYKHPSLEKIKKALK